MDENLPLGLGQVGNFSAQSFAHFRFFDLFRRKRGAVRKNIHKRLDIPYMYASLAAVIVGKGIVGYGPHEFVYRPDVIPDKQCPVEFQADVLGQVLRVLQCSGPFARIGI